MSTISHQKLKSVLILAGSFTFAFLLGEMIHEFGHFLGHKFYASPNAGVYLDPFGGSHITGTKGLSNSVLAVTSATGPLFNLVVGVIVSIILWRFRRPIILPLLMWGPVACIQEGVTFSLGLLTPGGDARWISTLGISHGIILSFGIMLLILGVVGVSLLLPLAGIDIQDSFWQKFLIVLTGMGTLMLIRAIYSFFVSPSARIENLVPLIFSLILAILVISINRPVVRWFDKHNAKFDVSDLHLAPYISVFLGISVFIFQILY